MRMPAPDLSSDGRWHPLRCSVQPHHEALWVQPEGELDLESAGVLKAVLDEYTGAGFPRLVLDLRGLTFIDSTGLHTIIDAGRAAMARGVEFAVSPGLSRVQRIFDVPGTAGLFPPPSPR